jgi:hypothetical protein
MTGAVIAKAQPEAIQKCAVEGGWIASLRSQ